MRKIIFKSVLVLIAAIAAPCAFAGIVAPDVLLKTATSEAIAIIKQDEDFQSGTPAKIDERVEARILPIFDFTRMTQIAMARHWRLATPAQQEALTAEFRTLLVRTYSIALSGYRNKAVEFKRMHTSRGDTVVTVKTLIRQPGAAPLSIDYDMEKLAAGWKVFDMKIEGVSLITSYRETFAGKIRDGGVDSLIKSLADKNKTRGVRFQSRATEDFYFSVVVRGVLLNGN